MYEIMQSAEFNLLLRFLASMALGALIGTERERAKAMARFAGIRTFTLITLFGTLSAHLAEIYSKVFILIAFAGMALLAILAYYRTTQRKGARVGATTEIAGMISFIIGVLCYHALKIAVAFGIILALILYLKQTLHSFVAKIRAEEFYGTLKFAIIALVVLPFLPNKAFDPFGVLNPYVIWWIVVLVSGISFFGYILVKAIGPQKGIGLSGFLGGLISSTVVALNFAERSKKNKRLSSALSIAVIIASSVMFIRILIEIGIFNIKLLKPLSIPLLLMAMATLIPAFIFSIKSSKKRRLSRHLKFHSPFSIGPALKFAALFTAILFFTKLAQTYLGSNGLYLASFASGFANIDAIIISIARLAADGSIQMDAAFNSIILAIFARMLFKGILVYACGLRSFAKRIIIAFIPVWITAIAVLLIT